jgi:site-specific DNA-methyltransferase (adenine-specific)
MDPRLRPPFWENQVLAGDARRLLPKLPGRTFDLVLTSPPYWPSGEAERRGEVGTEREPGRYLRALRTVGAEAKRLLKPGGWLVAVLGDPEGIRMPWRVGAALQRAGFVPGLPALWLAPNAPASMLETVLFFSRGRAECRKGCEVPHGGLWPLERPPPQDNYDLLPEEMVVAVIEGHCPAGGRVLDPFLGHGTVAEAAQRLGRRWCGIELDPGVAHRTQRRLERL